MKYIFELLLLLTVVSNLQAQKTVRGKVIDADDLSALPFVHIAPAGQESERGAISDIDGYFSISICDSCSFLRFSYVGYEEKLIDLKSYDYQQNIVVRLKSGNLNLSEVVVIAGENPAYRIIRNAIKNRKENNPENLNAFRYESYNKAIVFDKNNAPKEALLFRDSIPLQKDSMGLNFFYMMMESVTKRSFMKPDKDMEQILATRVSGFQNPGFAPLATAFQPFSFYRDLIPVLNKDYINPLSPGSIGRYEYRLEDTLYNQRGDSTFIISFFPKKGKNFESLKGQLYISTNNWAVEYVMAEPAEKTLLDLKFEQKYEFIDDKHWFPVQLNFELKINPYNEGWFTLQGKSYLKNIETAPKDLKKKDFGSLSVEMGPDAEKKADDFWKLYRIQPLDKKEELTYRTIDSFGQKTNLDGLLLFSQDLPQGMVPIGKLALDITRLIDYNPFEKLRLGLGLYTSSIFSKKFRIGGYFGYGFGDKAWKYGGDLLWHISPKKDISFQLEYKNDVAEPAPIFEKGSYLTQKISPAETFARRYLLPRLDYREKLEASFHFRIFRNIQLRPFACWQQINPGYDYQYSHDDINFNRTFSDAHAGLQLRWSYKEKYAEFNGQRSLTESRFPVLYLSYTKGFNFSGIGAYDYSKVMLGFEWKKFFRGLGKTSLNVLAGWTDKGLPYPLLFNGRGSRQNNIGIYNKNTFQTMGVNEFISDRFAYAFLTHNFGRIRFKSELIRPEIKICQSVGFGSLRNPLQHFDIPFKTMEKGFYETGLLVDNLFCYKVANVAYFGFGAGVFYRYGPYSQKLFTENTAVNLNFTVSF